MDYQIVVGFYVILIFDYSSLKIKNYLLVKQDLNQAIHVLCDILINSILNEESVDIERNVILQEMDNVNNEAKEELIFDHLHEYLVH